MRMRSWVASGLLLLLASSAFAKVEVFEVGSKRTYKVTVDAVTPKTVSIDGKSFQKLDLKGVDGYKGILYKEGEPEVPVVRLVVDGKGPIQVRTTNIMFRPLSSEGASVKLAPVQRSATKVAGARSVFMMNAASFNSSSYYPQASYEVKTLGTVRGVPRRLVTLHPVSYKSASGDLQVRNQFEVLVDNPGSDIVDLAKPAIALVVGPSFVNSPSLARYIQNKVDLGFHVDRMDLNSSATPDSIRAWLKQLYARSAYKLSFALMIGDDNETPAYDSRTINGITDHYYAAIDTNDYEDDIMTPDIGVGRFSARTEAQLEAQVEKSITYTTANFQSAAVLKGAAFLATDDRWQLAEGTHNYAIDTYTKLRGFEGIFPNLPEAGGDKLYAVTHRVPADKVKEAFAAGRSIINYSGHGANTFWDAPRVTQADVRNLSNPNALPFVISNACITGDFRVTESFAETWARQRYGAIVFWGSMDNTLWDEDDILERRMYDGIFSQGFTNFAQITTNALSELAKFYGGEGYSKYYFETYHIFGDPSLDLIVQK